MKFSITKKIKINKYLKIAAQSNASDLHLNVGKRPVMRVDGKLVVMEDQPVVLKKKMAKAATKLLNEQQKKALIKDRDLNIGMSLGDKARFKVNIHYEKSNIGLRARVLKMLPPTIEDISLPEALKDVVSYNQGLVIVAGGRSSGKTTTIASIIDYINKNRSESIVTLENPIEYIIKPIKSVVIQRQLGLDIITMESGIANAFAQDSEVVMIGDTRNKEALRGMLDLADSGRLVFVSVDAPDCAAAVSSVINSFNQDEQILVKEKLARNLKVVIAQKSFMKKEGGITVAREALFNSEEVAKIISEGELEKLRLMTEAGKKKGVITFEEDIKRLSK